MLLGVSGPVWAGDATVFVGFGSPRDTWKSGYGGALSSTWFRAVSLEAEAARLPGVLPDSTFTSFTGSALLAPPIGSVTPYGGFGVGLFRQGLGSEHDTGFLKALVLGLKLRVGGLLVLKGEYRRYDLSGTPLLALDSRYSLGAGISF
jgi:hypothetical protein